MNKHIVALPKQLCQNHCLIHHNVVRNECITCILIPKYFIYYSIFVSHLTNSYFWLHYCISLYSASSNLLHLFFGFHKLLEHYTIVHLLYTYLGLLSYLYNRRLLPLWADLVCQPVQRLLYLYTYLYYSNCNMLLKGLVKCFKATRYV